MKRSSAPVRPTDADLDQALRELGDEVLQEAIPEHLLEVVRAAAEAAAKADSRKARMPRRERGINRGRQEES
jgi:uncharacterized protein with von Willebrand factor type A (vWA) domain